MTEDRISSRRRVLRAGATLALAGGLAGCQGGSSGDGDGGGGTRTEQETEHTSTTTPAGDTTATPTCGQPTIEENVTTDTTLRSGCTYTLAAQVDVVEGATLTVEPGVTVEAEAGSRLLVDDGALVARGTEADPIEVRGTSPTREHWRGIVVETDDEANELAYVSVSDAGQYNEYYEANLAIGSENPARMRVRNCEFTNSAAAGLRVEAFGTLTGFGNNRFADNGGPPLDVKATQLGALEGSSSFADDASVLVRWDQNEAIETDATWPDVGVPYRMGVNVSNLLTLDGTVEIEPGAQFQFVRGAGLLVRSGALVAVGETDDPIEFVGTSDTPGHWKGIVVDSDAEANELDQVVLSDAGAYNGFYRANLCVGPTTASRMTVRNSQISDSSSWGIRLVTGDLVTEDNTYANNAEGDVERPDGE